MACHGYVDYDKLTETFRLPPEHAVVLADSESPFYLGSLFSMAEPFWKHVDQLARAFRDGGGIPHADFGEWVWCGFERFYRPAFRGFLCQEWIPGLPSVDAALRAGGSAADVGSGNGQALLALAGGYPNATRVGYDDYAPTIAAASANARGADSQIARALKCVMRVRGASSRRSTAKSQSIGGVVCTGGWVRRWRRYRTLVPTAWPIWRAIFMQPATSNARFATARKPAIGQQRATPTLRRLAIIRQSSISSLTTETPRARPR
jgi:hypothetical protein